MKKFISVSIVLSFIYVGGALQLLEKSNAHTAEHLSSMSNPTLHGNLKEAHSYLEYSKERNRTRRAANLFLALISSKIEKGISIAKRLDPLRNDYSRMPIKKINQEKCALIMLHAVTFPFPPPGYFSKIVSKFKFGVRENCIIKTPIAPRNPVSVIPPTQLFNINPILRRLYPLPSWFNFWMLPKDSVKSSIPGESKTDLNRSLHRIENIIEDLMSEGVSSENIVLMGFSQGGALTIYTAIHTKYKLGGFIPTITWLPLRKVEPIDKLPTPINKDTPILQVNGMLDLLVAFNAGKKTKKDMEKVFTRYQFKGILLGNHASTVDLAAPMIRRWIKENTNIGS